jgi:hypothetical protein
MVKHRESTKVRAIEVAAFVLGLHVKKMGIENGEASYKKPLPDDANWFQRYGNEMSLSKARSIYRQAADQFGYKNEKEIQRHLRIVDREGLWSKVVAEYEHDLAAEVGTATRRRRFEALETVKQMLGLLSRVG